MMLFILSNNRSFKCINDLIKPKQNIIIQNFKNSARILLSSLRDLCKYFDISMSEGIFSYSFLNQNNFNIVGLYLIFNFLIKILKLIMLLILFYLIIILYLNLLKRT